MYEIAKLKENDNAMYKEGVDLLGKEAAEDDRARAKHGTERWTRQPSRQAAEHLYTKVNEINGWLESAGSSDHLVKSKLKGCESAIQVLQGTDRDLEAYVPSSRRANLTPAVERAVDKLRSVLSEVNQLESRRKRKVQSLRDKARRDDISRWH